MAIKTCAVALTMVLGLFAGTAPAARAQETVFLKIGSSSLGGQWFPTMSLTASVINNEVPGAVATVTTGGAITNVRDIDTGKIQLGFSYTSTIAEAWEGQGAFKRPHRKIRTIGVYFDSSFQIAVRADSEIRSFQDIKGKRSTAGRRGWGSTQAYERMLECHGLSFDRIRETGGRVHHVGWSDAALLMKDRQVDVIQLAQSIPNPLVMELETAFPVRVLGMDKRCVDELVQKHPGYVAVKVPAGASRGQAEDAWTIGDNNVLVGSADLPEDLVYQITKAIYENPGVFASLGWLKNMSVENAANGVHMPFHKGAARYFQEKGLTVDAE